MQYDHRVNKLELESALFGAIFLSVKPAEAVSPK